MKRNEIKQLMKSPKAELESMLKDSREKARALKFDLAAGKVKNVAELRSQKRMIARIMTALNTETK